MAHIPQTIVQILSVILTIVTPVLSSPASHAIPAPSPHIRSKRHILQMCELIAYHTNRGCLDYNNYGCFCGLGNAASRPMDEVDECCKVHDRCYGQVTCYWMYPQMVGYDIGCDEEGCSCTNSPIFSSCAHTTCQCDLEFAQCLGRAQYNHHHSDFDRRECNRPRRRQEGEGDSSRSRRRRRRRRDAAMKGEKVVVV